jgi:para-aminobenzoate synthetase
LEFGGEVKRLAGAQHGIIRRVRHIGETTVEGKDTIFEGVRDLSATLYQSLCADIGQHSISSQDWDSDKWTPTERCPNLRAIAWVERKGAQDNSGVMDDRVLVGVQHTSKPFWGLQYHPESICTNSESRLVIKNWFRLAQNWNKMSRATPCDQRSAVYGKPPVRESLSRQYDVRLPSADSLRADIELEQRIINMELENTYQITTIKLPNIISVPDIVEAVQDLRRDHIILESSNIHERSAGSAEVRGRYSIVALDVDDALRFEYTSGSGFIRAIYPEDNLSKDYMINLRGIGAWPFLASFLDKRRIVDGYEKSPFWGGFMGYTTYELGLEGIGVCSKPRNSQHGRPDLNFAWVTRSLVVDHVENLVHIQALVKKDAHQPAWMDAAALKLKKLSLPGLSAAPLKNIRDHLYGISTNSSQTSISTANSDTHGPPSLASSDSGDMSNELKEPQDFEIAVPDNDEYESKVSHCQDFIRSGNSYEICLTDQTTVQCRRFDAIQKPSDPHSVEDIVLSHKAAPPVSAYGSWSLYRTLRTRNPAPFASYIRLGSATLVSASPERFLSWTSAGLCELRPMKGTVRKSPAVPDLATAIPLLDVPKEKAENLMIVDLVRHDLHGICGSGAVQVPRLMVVEEYRNVFQMISIVQGQITHAEGDNNSRYTGVDVLAASLPPGSMTGAPKKRSCEILQSIEDKERSLYSGVVGYMDVGGRGDWSVTIRCMFRWDDEDTVSHSDAGEERRTEQWHIGAGGAVTTLSTPLGEREEMQTKLNGTLGVFR